MDERAGKKPLWQRFLGRTPRSCTSRPTRRPAGSRIRLLRRRCIRIAAERTTLPKCARVHGDLREISVSGMGKIRAGKCISARWNAEKVPACKGSLWDYGGTRKRNKLWCMSARFPPVPATAILEESAKAAGLAELPSLVEDLGMKQDRIPDDTYVWRRRGSEKVWRRKSPSQEWGKSATWATAELRCQKYWRRKSHPQLRRQHDLKNNYQKAS